MRHDHNRTTTRRTPWIFTVLAAPCLMAASLAAPAQAAPATGGQVTVYSYTNKGYGNHTSGTYSIGPKFTFKVRLFGCRDGGGGGQLTVWDPTKQPKSNGGVGLIKAWWSGRVSGNHTWSKYSAAAQHVKYSLDGGDLVDCHYTVTISEYRANLPQ
jgi:hypothetical protein